jgi:hypothetical protein
VSPEDLSDHRHVGRTATSDGLIGVAENYRTGWPDSPEYAVERQSGALEFGFQPLVLLFEFVELASVATRRT